MRILCVDQENMGLPFALRCARAGHEVRLYRHTPKRPERYGEGFKEITLVEKWREHIAWAKDGLVVPSGNFTLTHELDRYRDFGYPIFGPTRQSARLEIDRAFGMETMRAAGIELPPYQTFATMQEAEKFARKSDNTYVFKVLDGSAEDKALTYVSRDAADLVGWLRRKINAGVNISKCMLQEKIDTDFEIGVNGWFGPEGFLPSFQISFEHKPLMPGDIGPNTGEMIGLSQYVESDRIVDELLMPLAPALAALGHRGDFCVGAMIDKAGKPWPLECTSRMGYPAWFGQMASHRGDPATWMKALLDGEDKLRVSYDVCAAVVLAQPNWPYNNSPAELVQGNPIEVSADIAEDSVHFCGVMKGRGPVLNDGQVIMGEQLQTTAEYVLVATALGKTIARARDKVYSTIDGVHFPNMMYRDDAGLKVERALSKMHKAGFALELA